MSDVCAKCGAGGTLYVSHENEKIETTIGPDGRASQAAIPEHLCRTHYLEMFARVHPKEEMPNLPE